jgi:hypothetical protein
MVEIAQGSVILEALLVKCGNKYHGCNKLNCQITGFSRYTVSKKHKLDAASVRVRGRKTHFVFIAETSLLKVTYFESSY